MNRNVEVRARFAEPDDGGPNAERRLYAASWLWLALMDRHGTTHDGVALTGIDAALEYAFTQAQEGASPRELDNSADSLRFLMGLTELSSGHLAVDTGHGGPEIQMRVYSVTQAAVARLMDVGLFRWIEPCLERLIAIARATSSAAIIADASSIASSVLREQRNSAQALQVMDSVADWLQDADLPSRAKYSLNRGNLLKDLDRHEEAQLAYEEAWSLAGSEETSGSFRATIALQLGRHWQERHRLDEARKWFDVAGKIGYSGTLADEYNWLLNVSRLQADVESGDLTTGIRIAELFVSLAAAPRPDLEAGLHNLVDRAARALGLGLEREWGARMALAAGTLGGRRRERAALLGDLALSLVSRGRGGEAQSWFSRAAAVVDATATQLHDGPNTMSLAYCAYFFGLDMDAVVRTHWIDRYRDVLLRREDDGPESRLHDLAQYALLGRDVRPAEARAAAAEARRIAAEVVVPIAPASVTDFINMMKGAMMGDMKSVLEPPAKIPGLGFLAAFEVQAEDPSALSNWYSTLRSSKQRAPHRNGALQTMLDGAGEAGVEAGANVPFLLSMRRGVLSAELCTYGYLRFMLFHMGLPPRRALQWALEISPSSEVTRRLAVEWMLCPSGQTRVAKESTDELERDLRQLRAVQELHQFELDLADRTPPGLPHPPSTERGNEALEGLRAAYCCWRTRVVLDGNGMLDAMQVPKSLAIGINDFLSSQFDEQRREARADDKELPYVAMLLLGQYCSTWVIIDLEGDSPLGHVSTENIPMSLEDVRGATFRIARLLQRQERGEQCTSEDIQFVFELGRQLLAGVERHVPRGRSIRLFAEGLWSSIPIEQLPIDASGEGLADRYQVIRFKVGGLWDAICPRPRIHVRDVDAVVLVDPLDGAFGLDAARKEGNELGELLGATFIAGENVTAARLMAEVKRRHVVHIACHGCSIETEHRDYLALSLSDRYVLEAELANLDLASCRLATIAACRSAQGDAYGLAPAASMATAVMEAGAATVLGALTSVSNRRTQDDVLRFYRALLAGKSPSGALRHAFGADERQRQGVLIFPWVAWGHDGVIFEVNHG